MTKTRLIALSLAGMTAIGIAVSPVVLADKYQDQINAINGDSSAKQGDKDQLGSQAADLQDQIAKLRAETANLQTQIGINEKKRDDTVAQITQAETDLTHQRQVLGDNLKAMYVDGTISSLEMLASSRDLNSYADQKQYHQAVQSQIQTSLNTINALKVKLSNDKTTLERMIAGLNDMKTEVASQQAQQSRLLSLNQQQQDDLDGQIKANNSKVNELRKQQAMENARLASGKIPAGVKGGGGYPGVWAFAAQDTLIDSWGMYNRECVSWTAYKVAASGRYMPYWGGRGNANQWDDNARAAGIPVDGNPREGDVAVSNNGYYGHVMYVESVASDGSIFVSDYNQQYDGLYRAYWISAATVSARNLVFVHF